MLPILASTVWFFTMLVAMVWLSAKYRKVTVLEWLRTKGPASVVEQAILLMCFTFATIGTVAVYVLVSGAAHGIN